MSENEATELRNGKVIPDVLPEGTKLAHQITVKWPTTTLDKSGKELDREATQPEPTLLLTPEVNIIPCVKYCTDNLSIGTSRPRRLCDHND
jgi:hypothetical protein